MKFRAKPPAEQLEKIRVLASQALPPEEFIRLATSPMSEEEREEKRSLIAWFNRRYKTPLERLNYARKVYKRLCG